MKAYHRHKKTRIAGQADRRANGGKEPSSTQEAKALTQPMGVAIAKVNATLAVINDGSIIDSGHWLTLNNESGLNAQGAG